jgi:FtsZ-binding cell division protein ZapB
MAKGPEKNTKNKALHSKLLKRKNTKIQEEKKAQAARLKALVAKMNEVNQMKCSDDSIPKDS